MLDSLKIFIPVLNQVWEIIKVWWWLPLPFILWWPFSFLWIWGRTEVFSKKHPMILLEVKIPQDILRPIRAMEVVLDGMWQTLYDPPDPWERWIEGKYLFTFSFEIASIGGTPHFFIRVPRFNRDAVEAIFYAQYPDIEISEAEDYVKKVPADIPNKNWDLWGVSYRLERENPYPIKTYPEFESEREVLEEKRIDPVATLLESMAKIGKGEQLWIQINCVTVTNDEVPWVDEGENIRDFLSKRKPKNQQRTIIGEATDILLTGKVEGADEEPKELLPPEMKLTSGERDIVAAIEKKMAKRGFHTDIRFIYLGDKEHFYKPKLRLPLAFFSNFVTQNLNGLRPMGQPYITKIKYRLFFLSNLFLKRRLYLRKRQIFRSYRERKHPRFPRLRKYPSSFILNTEELATIFHFPGRKPAAAPFVERIQTKKGEAPTDLPTIE